MSLMFHHREVPAVGDDRVCSVGFLVSEKIDKKKYLSEMKNCCSCAEIYACGCSSFCCLHPYICRKFPYTT